MSDGWKVDFLRILSLKPINQGDMEHVTSFYEDDNDNIARAILLEIRMKSLVSKNLLHTVSHGFKNKIAFKNTTRAIAGRRPAIADKSHAGLVPTAT